MKRIRLFATVLAACLTASLSAQQPTDIIVESYPDGKNATGFSKIDGNWSESVNKSGAEGLTASKAMYKTLELPGAAMFKADVPADGKYDVFVTYPSSGNASGVIYTITHADGNTTVTQDQFGAGNDPATAPNTWIPLGTYEFKKDRPATVEIVDPKTKISPDPTAENQRIYADAIKLSPNAGTPMVAAVSTIGGVSAAPVVAASLPVADSSSVPGAPAVVAITTATAEGLSGLSAAVPAQNLPGLSAASPAQNLPSLSAASPAQNLPSLSAASPGQNLPGLSAAAGATTPTTAAPAVADAAPAAPATALPGLSSATSAPPSTLPGLTAVAATPISLSTLTALPDAATSAPAIAALPSIPATTPNTDTPALPLLGAPVAPTMLADTPAAPPLPLAPAAVTPAPAPDPSVMPVPTLTFGVAGAADLGWSYDIGAAQTVAEKKDQKIFVFFTAPNNRMGEKYETEYFTQPAVRAQIDRFVPLRLNFPTNSHYAYKLGAMGAGKIVIIDRAETVLLNIDQIPASAEELAKLLEGVK